MDAMAYCNEVLARYEELVFQELAQASMWKPEYVGIDYIQSKNINGSTVEEVIDSCIRVMKEDELITDITYNRGAEGIALKLVVKNCIHMPKEIRLKEAGVKPYCCPITNMMLDRILELLHFEITFLGGQMEIDEVKGECVVRCGIWENADKIGIMSDWQKL